MPERPLDDDPPLSADLLLRRAAEGDAARAVELLTYVGPTKLLDAVLTQAELAVDEDRHRPAGIDAIAELDRASIEVMGLPQGADLNLGLDTDDGHGEPIDLEIDLRALADHEPEDDTDPSVAGMEQPWFWQPDGEPALPDAADIVWHADDDGIDDAPVLIGWELLTVGSADLQAAVLTLPIRPWHLALVAFIDEHDASGILHRRVAAATADGRVIGACLRFTSPETDPDILDAAVTHDPDDLGERSALAASLRAALRSAARGIG